MSCEVDAKKCVPATKQQVYPSSNNHIDAIPHDVCCDGTDCQGRQGNGDDMNGNDKHHRNPKMDQLRTSVEVTHFIRHMAHE